MNEFEARVRICCEDIETALEEFETLTGAKIIGLNFKRIDLDEQKCHKPFEYLVSMTSMDK